MDIGEAVNFSMLGPENEAKCPYKLEAEGASEEEGEGIAKDDLPAATSEQENNGGTLGKNLESGSHGKGGTTCPPFDLAKAKGDPRLDTRRGGHKVRVPGTKDIAEDVYGYTVAAHHLVPGEAALAPSKLKPFMTKDGEVEVLTPAGPKKKKLTKHIGYNVNGAHNGVWLPGNYYVRATTSPISGQSWSDLGDNPWCLNYVAAVIKAAGGQMHDAHTIYSAGVKGWLNKIAGVMSKHECDACKGDTVNPPFKIKARLYAMSKYLRGQVKGAPGAWVRPWFTSDRWRDQAFSGGKAMSPDFMAAYLKASRVDGPGGA